MKRLLMLSLLLSMSLIHVRAMEETIAKDALEVGFKQGAEESAETFAQRVARAKELGLKAPPIHEIPVDPAKRLAAEHARLATAEQENWAAGFVQRAHAPQPNVEALPKIEEIDVMRQPEEPENLAPKPEEKSFGEVEEKPAKPSKAAQLAEQAKQKISRAKQKISRLVSRETAEQLAQKTSVAQAALESAEQNVQRLQKELAAVEEEGGYMHTEKGELTTEQAQRNLSDAQKAAKSAEAERDAARLAQAKQRLRAGGLSPEARVAAQDEVRRAQAQVNKIQAELNGTKEFDKSLPKVLRKAPKGKVPSDAVVESLSTLKNAHVAEEEAKIAVTTQAQEVRVVQGEIDNAVQAGKPTDELNTQLAKEKTKLAGAKARLASAKKSVGNALQLVATTASNNPWKTGGLLFVGGLVGTGLYAAYGHPKDTSKQAAAPKDSTVAAGDTSSVADTSGTDTNAQ